MSTDRDVTRIVRSWLQEDAHEDPQRVLDGVRDQLDANRQSRARWLARRSPEMSNTLRIPIAAAAIVVVALVGIRFLAPGTSGGAVATPTPTPIAAPTPVASPTSSPTFPPIPKSGDVAAGRYTIKVPDGRLSVALTLGSGWRSGDWYVNSDEFNAAIAFFNVGNVYEDICDRGGGLPTASALPDPPIGPTVDDLVSALDAQVNTDMSPAVDVEVGGSAGKRVTITESDPYADYCMGFDNVAHPMWVDPHGLPGRGVQPGQLDTLWIVDVGGQRLVIVTIAEDPSDVETAARIAAVIDSIEFVLP
jgi:hypothetical protein